MVEFTENLRRKCRRCKSKLPTPTSNEREAFCCRGCYEQFYRKRCRVCECDINQPTEEGEKQGRPRLICKKAKCKSAWRAGIRFGRFLQNPSPSSSDVKKGHAEAVKSSVSKRTKPGRAEPIECSEPLRSCRGWHIVAGPLLSHGAFHAATVPDGPDCKWTGGTYQRAEARNKAILEEHFKQQQRSPEAERARESEYTALIRACADWQIGERYPAAYGGDPKQAPAWKRVMGQQGTPVIGDGLDMPDFLRRSPATTSADSVDGTELRQAA